jgi:hypothetical protein
MKAGAGRAILLAGLVAGVLDILAAIALTVALGGQTVRMLKGIAGGLLGRAAAQKGGLPTAALGLFLHFVIATGAAAVFYVASRRMPVLLARPVLAGILYGVVVYLVMNLVVLPLSALGWRPLVLNTTTAILVVIHMLCVGLPIALVVRRHSR